LPLGGAAAEKRRRKEGAKREKVEKTTTKKKKTKTKTKKMKTKKTTKTKKKEETHLFLPQTSSNQTSRNDASQTSPAAFEMDEFLFELREHSAGLNCGRWDYIFSLIKTLREQPGAVVPDRGAVGMTQHCMRSYSLLLIKTCHRRGVHAMGGMAAQIPIKGDDAANAAALAKVKADKLRVS
jgi:hypothetical protein